MFHTILTTSETAISAWQTLVIVVEAFIMGVLIGGCYILTQRKHGYSKEYVVAIAVLPAIVALVIILVGNSTARALSLAGAFALVRFRSAQGSAKEIAFVFFAMSIGLSAGLGFVFLAPIATVIISGCIIILCKSKFGEKKAKLQMLKISIPEDLNYDGLFDDLFKEYTSECDLVRVRTTNMGTLYELTYYVILKDSNKQKDFIDSIRCRNGNLNISIGIIPEKIEPVL